MGKSKLHDLAAWWRAKIDEYDRWRYVRHAQGRMPWAILLRVTVAQQAAGWMALACWAGLRKGQDIPIIRQRMIDAEMRLYARLPPDDRRSELMREALYWIAQGDTPDVAAAKEMLGYCWAYGIGGPCRERAAAWWFLRAGEGG